jgi:hypothetical protein
MERKALESIPAAIHNRYALHSCALQHIIIEWRDCERNCEETADRARFGDLNNPIRQWLTYLRNHRSHAIRVHDMIAWKPHELSPERRQVADVAFIVEADEKTPSFNSTKPELARAEEVPKRPRFVDTQRVVLRTRKRVEHGPARERTGMRGFVLRRETLLVVLVPPPASATASGPCQA